MFLDGVDCLWWDFRVLIRLKVCCENHDFWVTTHCCWLIVLYIECAWAIVYNLLAWSACERKLKCFMLPMWAVCTLTMRELLVLPSRFCMILWIVWVHRQCGYDQGGVAGFIFFYSLSQKTNICVWWMMNPPLSLITVNELCSWTLELKWIYVHFTLGNRRALLAV